MLSDIIAARTPDEEPLSFEELVATARALLINTHDSMSTAFTQHPVQGRDGCDDLPNSSTPPPTTIRSMGRFVEELMRLEPPVRALSRVTTEPVTLGDTPLAGGRASADSLRLGQR